MVVLRGGLCVDYLPMIKHLNNNVYCLSNKFSNLFTSDTENVIDMGWKMKTGAKASKEKFRVLLAMVSKFFMFKMKPHSFLNLVQTFTQLFLAPGL